MLYIDANPLFFECIKDSRFKLQLVLCCRMFETESISPLHESLFVKQIEIAVFVFVTYLVGQEFFFVANILGRNMPRAHL